MRHRLRPGLRSVWRGPGTLQLGLGGRDALVLTGITDSDVTFLDLLAVGVSAAAVRGGTVPPGPARCARLLAHLGEAGLLLTPAPGPADGDLDPDPDPEPRGAVLGWSLSGEDRERLAPDAVAWSWVREEGDPRVTDGWDVVTARTAHTVQVNGLGRTGWAVAATLAAAGVGVVGLDRRPVVPGDLSPCGPAAEQLGLARDRAFAQAWPAQGTAVTLVVLVEPAAADAVGADRLVSGDVPHLSVVIGEARSTVGPLVLPGRSACLRCLDLHRTERDPAWPSVAAQLTAQGLRAGLAVDSPLPGGEETVLALATGALAAAQVLAHLDGRPASTIGATLELSLPSLLPARRAWPVHPACGCVHLAGGPAASGAPLGAARMSE